MRSKLQIFGDTFSKLSNIWMGFHFLDRDIVRKIITTMIRPKLEYAKNNKNKHVLKLERIQRIATNMVPDLEHLTYEERLKEMHLTTLKERRERGDLIIIYKLMNDLEGTERKNLKMKRKEEDKYLREHKKKLLTGISMNDTKKTQFSPEKHRYLEWIEERHDNGKECTSSEGKLDKYPYGDRTTQVLLRYCTLQLGNYS